MKLYNVTVTASMNDAECVCPNLLCTPKYILLYMHCMGAYNNPKTVYQYIWPNGIIFHQPRFPWKKGGDFHGIPFPKCYLLGGPKVVFSVATLCLRIGQRQVTSKDGRSNMWRRNSPSARDPKLETSLNRRVRDRWKTIHRINGERHS